MRDHTKLRAFELADQLAILVYKTTVSFPKEEMFASLPRFAGQPFQSLPTLSKAVPDFQNPNISGFWK
jgi:hypothetical protein